MSTPARHEAHPELSGGGYLSAHFPATEETARLARHACRPLLPLIGEGAGDLQLLVSELVTNSVRHAGVEGENAVWLEVVVGPDHIRVEVADRGAGFEAPPRVEPGVWRIGGWGLFMVDELCDRWGILNEAGTHVWAQLPYRSEWREQGVPAPGN